MGRNNDHRGVEHIRTTLGKETDFRGTMRFQDSLKIEGRFTGEIISPGYLYIEEGAIVHADIHVSSIVIGGIVHGNIEASEGLEMLSTGRVFGDIRTAKLKIADGVIYEGKCQMIKSPERIDIFSDRADRVKKAVQSV